MNDAGHIRPGTLALVSLCLAAPLTAGVRGKYVHIFIPGNGKTLTLAEVEVFSSDTNVAKGCRTSQSSTAHGGAPRKAVDGNTSDNYESGSQTHTNKEKNPWWEVELKKETTIDRIAVWNRGENLGSRLNGFHVCILDADHRVAWEESKDRPGRTTRFEVTGAGRGGLVGKILPRGTGGVKSGGAQGPVVDAVTLKKLNDDIEKAIADIRQYLLAKQNADGSFGGTTGLPHLYERDEKTGAVTFKSPNSNRWKNKQIRAKLMGVKRLPVEPQRDRIFVTAAVVHALLAAGTDLRDKKIQAALKYLQRFDTHGVHGIAMRCIALSAADRRSRPAGRHGPWIIHDATRLVLAFGSNGLGTTVWHEDRNNCSNRLSAMGTTALQRFSQNPGGSLPAGAWKTIRDFWERGQLDCGGWGRRVGVPKDRGHEQRGVITTAAIAALYTCLDAVSPPAYLECGNGTLPESIRKGHAFLGGTFAGMVQKNNPKFADHGKDFGRFLWRVALLGNTSGYGRFAKRDWYRFCVEKLFEKYPGGINSEGLPATAFSLLFLVEGRRPVLFGKLRFTGDWNNRPRDIAHLTAWMGNNTDWRCAWRILGIEDGPVAWRDTPVLYLSGSKDPGFTDAHIKKIRAHVCRGGIIFSVTEGKDGGFDEAMRRVYEKAFPRYPLTKIPPGHPVYARPNKMMGKPPLETATNGVRPLVVHAAEDIANIWQERTLPAQKRLFMFGENLAALAAGAPGRLLPRPLPYGPPSANTGNAKKVTVLRVKHSGNYDPEPLAWTAAADRLARDEKIDLRPCLIPIERMGSERARLAVMTGTGTVELSGEELKALKKYISGGGTLLVDAAGGCEEFYQSISAVLSTALGNPEPIGTDAPVITRPENPIDDAGYRPAAEKRHKLKRGGTGGSKAAVLMLEVIRSGDRPAVYLSREDITFGLLGFPGGWMIDGYENETAYDIVRNIVMIHGVE